MTVVPRPNFFIVGAPKCGTTAMARYLARHPSVFICEPKEPHYFNFDLDDPIVRRNWASLDEYLGLFESASDALAIGDASVFYLMSRVALEEIYRYDPTSRIIVMIRNPIDLVHSFHSQLLFSGQETLTDVSEAWHAQRGRSGSELLQYGKVAKVGGQITRALRVFPRAQIHMCFFDDFQDDTRREFHKVLDFLDLPPGGPDDFPVINANRGYRSLRLQRLMESLPDPTPLKRLLGIKSIGLFERIKKLNFRRFERDPMPEELVDEMREFFREDVDLLSGIVGRDLSGWLAES